MNFIGRFEKMRKDVDDPTEYLPSSVLQALGYQKSSAVADQLEDDDDNDDEDDLGYEFN